MLRNFGENQRVLLPYLAAIKSFTVQERSQKTLFYRRSSHLPQEQKPQKDNKPGAPNEEIVQNHLTLALLNVF